MCNVGRVTIYTSLHFRSMNGQRKVYNVSNPRYIVLFYQLHIFHVGTNQNSYVNSGIELIASI